MTDTPMAAVVDVAFPLDGAALPRDHRLALAEAVAQAVPWIRDEPEAAVFPDHLVHGHGGGAEDRVLLSARSRLVIRAPRTRLPQLGTLAGQALVVSGLALRLGTGRTRELLPHGTLYAHFVAAPQVDEAAFLDATLTALADLHADRCHPVCGRHQQVRAEDGPIGGYSLMLHGLSREASLRILEHGLGPRRLMGCGVFVPHKSAAAVGGH